MCFSTNAYLGDVFLIIPTNMGTFLERNKELQEKTQNWIDKGKEDGGQKTDLKKKKSRCSTSYR